MIAATHQNLEKRVRDGQFREDLFHRLNVIRLRLPPLRERREDIADLAVHFLAKSAKTLGVESKVLAPSALEAMMAYSFPGNVRELENLCHRLAVMAPSQRVELNDLPPELLDASGQGKSFSVRPTFAVLRWTDPCHFRAEQTRL